MAFGVQNENTSPTQNLDSQVDISAHLKLKRKREADVDPEAMVEGARIVVVEEFKSNQAKQRTLTVGLTGTVARTDEAKDANISFDFEDGAAKHWVLKKNFNKLKVVEEETEIDDKNVEETA